MSYSAKILADSISPAGARLTTWELTYPRFVHSELMTHREFSRNAGSSRAIPIEKMIQRVIDDPVLPVWWGKNQPGMQANEELVQADIESAKLHWLLERDAAVERAMTLSHLGLHKQIVNRILEPWMWITVLVSATNFSNWFQLRCDPAAQPEIRKLALMMRDVYYGTRPKSVPYFGLHTPLIRPEEEHEFDFATRIKVSVGRCARVSYLTHDGKRDPAADVELHDRLLTSGHWSPFEHVAHAMGGASLRSGNFTGWLQYRKNFSREYVSEYACPAA